MGQVLERSQEAPLTHLPSAFVQVQCIYEANAEIYMNFFEHRLRIYAAWHIQFSQADLKMGNFSMGS